jgi:hypothetical protein
MMALQKTIRRHLVNMRGMRSTRKLVVIESDDWGSIRMPSREVFESLQAEGFHPETDPYMKYDSLESDEDLQQLFQVLSGVKDSRGRGAVITANAVMANPDFDRIREGGFREYHYEPFTTTLQRYEGRGNVYRLWKQGLQEGIFIPQFHGREHLHVLRWMRDLAAGDPMLLKAFGYRMISISSMPSKMRFSYMEGMDHGSEEERKAKKPILETGHRLFISLVGYPSKSFIANCYIWDRTVEEVLAAQGVRLMQGILNQICPTGHGSHRLVRHYMGERKNNMAYTIRNVFFEPSLDPSVEWVDDAISRIGIAFAWGKPAVIGSHRVNFSGSIHRENRERNLEMLDRLLRRILVKWPDAEFISSADLADIIFSNQTS